MRTLLLALALSGCMTAPTLTTDLCSISGIDRQTLVAELHSTEAQFSLACKLAGK